MYFLVDSIATQNLEEEPNSNNNNESSNIYNIYNEKHPIDSLLETLLCTECGGVWIPYVKLDYWQCNGCSKKRPLSATPSVPFVHSGSTPNQLKVSET